MGVAIGDYDHDGWMDAIVTNDTLPNFLPHNERNGRFKEVGLKAGIALDDDGKAISAVIEPYKPAGRMVSEVVADLQAR